MRYRDEIGAAFAGVCLVVVCVVSALGAPPRQAAPVPKDANQCVAFCP